MKRYRVALCGLILLMVLVMLSGCHAEYECTIKFKEGTEAEGMLQLLIPLAEEDSEYREQKEIDGVRKSAPSGGDAGLEHSMVFSPDRYTH